MSLEAVAEQLFFDFDSLLDGEADAVVDSLLAVAHGDGSILGDLVGQLQDILHQLSLRIHCVDQANAISLVSLDVQCRVDQLLCHAHANQTCQTLGAAEARGDAQTDFRLTKHSVVGADADVAAHSQLIAAAQCKAVDGCDDGDGEALDHQEHIIAQFAESLALGLGHGAHGADVSACHEALVAFAGQDDAADGGLVNCLKSSLQVCQNFGVQGVQCLRAVDGDDLDCALHLGFYKCHCENLHSGYILFKTVPDKGQVSGLAHCPGCINIRSDPSKGNQSISTMVAQPMPPPMHRVARPL